MILCVDPDASARERTRAALSEAGFDVVAAGSLADGRAVLDEHAVECVVTEHELPDGTGLELVDAVRERYPDAACVLFTATSLDNIDTGAFGSLVAEYVHKDDDHDELVDVVEHALAFRSQTAYPLPENEDARLAALERYTSETESLGDSLDRLTELAAELLDVDSAAVGIIDTHTEEFLSCHGIDFGTMDRDESVCTYAILDDDVTVVENVQADPRFADNDALRAANIRFYAGKPLVTPDGEAIGTFCVQDGESRGFPDRDRELLSMLGDEAMEQLTLRRRIRDARRGGRDD
ncbi:GAF domain-containing protein [Halobacterium sp. KA-6]|jgi:CheY-like chemotaxis protein|uniref:GAF domain-containing protein n=1 Tax=Halobacterium sp. KA-6 TaxID=2896368 RepID=UPI001E4310DF|nr:GAF domain-containing protein [Halobacterium sp. KA-6]MCD2202243.1 GAF domain-containing protein [Halobacterium sp. KA-6]